MLVKVGPQPKETPALGGHVYPQRRSLEGQIWVTFSPGGGGGAQNSKCTGELECLQILMVFP